MCDKVADDFLPKLKFVPDWLVTSKMIKTLNEDLFTNDGIIFINEGPKNVTFFGGEMVILSVDFDENNLDEVNFDEDDPEAFIHVRLMAWCNRSKQCKPCKKDISK